MLFYICSNMGIDTNVGVCRYLLNQQTLDNDENVVDEKIFTRRDSMKEEQFTNIIKSYTREASIGLMSRYGMEAEIFPYYDSSDNSMKNVKEHDLYRVLARK